MHFCIEQLRYILNTLHAGKSTNATAYLMLSGPEQNCFASPSQVTSNGQHARENIKYYLQNQS